MSTEESQSLSALRENIETKGKNSYYYAHGPKIDGPSWDGKEEPRLISSTNVATAIPQKKVYITSIDSFSWLDETKNVKVYIDWENANEVADDSITLSTTENSVDFRLSIGEDKEHRLILDPLINPIVSATYRKKADKFVLVLKKDSETAWYQLKKTS